MKIETVLIERMVENSDKGMFIIPFNRYNANYINKCIKDGIIVEIIKNKNYQNLKKNLMKI